MPTQNSWNVDKLLNNGEAPEVLLVKIVPLQDSAHLTTVSVKSVKSLESLLFRSSGIDFIHLVLVGKDDANF